MKTDAENIAAIQKHVDDYRKRESMRNFNDLEKLILERKAKWGDRDGYTPEQRCAMALFRNGQHNEALFLASKQTLRRLFNDGLIDASGHGTKKLDKIVAGWKAEDWLNKCDRFFKGTL